MDKGSARRLKDWDKCVVSWRWRVFMFLQCFLFCCCQRAWDWKTNKKPHVTQTHQSFAMAYATCEKHSPYLPHVCHILCHSSLLCCLSFSFVVHSSRILGSTSIMIGALLVLLMCGALSNGKKIKNSLNLNPQGIQLVKNSLKLNPQGTQLALTGASWSRSLCPCPPPRKASLGQTSASTGTWTRCVWSDLLCSSIVL